MTFISKILNAGISDETPNYLLTPLRTTNIANVALSGVILLFNIIFYLTAPSLVPIMILAIGLILFSLLAQSKGFDLLSRLVTGTVICGLASVVYAFLLNQQESLLPKTFTACALLVLTPWFLFPLKQKNYAIVSFAVNCGIVVSIDRLKEHLHVTGDLSLVATELVQNLVLFSALFIIVAFIVGLQYSNKLESLKVEKLIEEIKLENEESLKKEASLNEVLEKLQTRQEEEKERNRATSGIAEIGQLLRHESDFQSLVDRLIIYIVNYLGVNQGALFLAKEDGENIELELKACYAYNRKKYLNKKVSIGQGLVGQCFLEKDYIYMTEVPEGYISIRSGLGDATPSAILIVPMIVNDKVYGVMEFASFSEFQKHEIDFLMEVGVNVAMSLHNILINEKTKELLASTQMQAEEMKAQDEEMRQNMEEITAAHEQQARIEMELNERLREKELENELLKKKLNLFKHSDAQSTTAM